MPLVRGRVHEHWSDSDSKKYGMSIQNKEQHGFTLIEIAIVLLIIGLLVGGVLKGQELIYNQKVKSTYDAYRQYTAAMYGYQDRCRDQRQIPIVRLVRL